jgi:hypothetical protein
MGRIIYVAQSGQLSRMKWQQRNTQNVRKMANVCVCVCVYTCVYVSMYAFTYVCNYACTCVCKYVCTCVYVYVQYLMTLC